MIARQVADLVKSRLQSYPAVALIGPRQVGKTTLARSLSAFAPSALRRDTSAGPAYFDLEQPGDRLRLDLQWDQLLTGAGPIVLDEAQSWPDLFPRLRGAIDAERRTIGPDRHGRFLLLGSVSPGLMREVSESLAGRLSLVELSPFLLDEIPHVPLERLWLCGGFPEGGILDAPRFPQWQHDYLTLLAERDLPVWGLPAKPPTTRRLFRMLAALHGQVWNASDTGQSLGLSYHTVNSYLDFLEGAFLIRRLPPWLPNLRKRVVRSPRVYWRDSGLLHAELGVSTEDDLLAHPIAGKSWEGFVIQQILGALAARGTPVEPFWFRTADGLEVDLVIARGTSVWAIETKLTSRPSDQDFARFTRAADLAGAHRRYLIAPVSEPSLGDSGGVLSLPDFLARL